jgi:hypothetical protein
MSSSATALRAERPNTHKARLRVVDSQARIQTRRVRLVAWVISALVVLGLLAAVAFHVQLAQGQLELDRLERQTAAAREQYQQLRLQFAQESSPAAIGNRASALGMVHAGDVPTYLVVPDAPTSAPSPDQTSTTLQEGWKKVKPHLGTQP